MNNQDVTALSALTEKTASESLLNLNNTTNQYNIDISSSYNYGKYYSDNKEFYFSYKNDGNNSEYVNVYATIKLKDTEILKSFDEDEFNIKYNHALTYNGNQYNVVLKLNSINRTINSAEREEQEIYFQVARYKKQNSSQFTWDIPAMEKIDFIPGVGASATNGGHTEIGVTFAVQDDNGNDVNVSGLFKLADIDLQQGIAVESLGGQIYMPEETKGSGSATDTIYYYGINIPSGAEESAANGKYFYSNTDQNLTQGKANVYFTKSSSSKIDLQFTFDSKEAFSNIGYCNDIETYNKVTTEVENGTITPSNYYIRDGEDKTITYEPQDETYYLKQIVVDGNVVSTTTYPDSYTFSNINEDHTISVKYAKKCTVTFDSKGGTEINPDNVIPGETATEPANPTKNGSTFKGWYTDENYTTLYDFSTPVNEDITLYAKWEESSQEESKHKIEYIIKGTPNDNNATTNPTEYTEGSTEILTIKNPTLSGYTFSGWYENEDLSGSPIASLNVSNRTDDITLYGKWIKNEEPDTTATYKVNHYLEDSNGTIDRNGKKYKLDTTDNKTGTINTSVTENSKTYAGYKAEQNSLTGTVVEDGSLTLDFYYNKEQYTITFDSKGGTEVSDQTKNYNEKVDEPEDPTKEGYTFWYWYEEVNGEKKVYDFDTPVTEDKTLIAEWKENKVTPDTDTSKNNTYTTGKVDTTTATKILPNTGIIGTAIITIVVLIGAFFGIRYFKLRKDMK